MSPFDHFALGFIAASLLWIGVIVLAVRAAAKHRRPTYGRCRVPSLPHHYAPAPTTEQIFRRHAARN